MENPFSYRNKLANDLKNQRKAIDNGTSERTREDLYNNLTETQHTSEYLSNLQKHENKRREKIRRGKEKKKKEFEKFNRELDTKGNVQEVTFLNEEMAKKILNTINTNNNGKLKVLHFMKLEKITTDAARILAKYNGEIFIPFDSITGDVNIAKELGKHKNHTAFLNVGNISPEIANTYKNAIGDISLRDVKGSTITEDIAKELTESKARITIYIKDKIPESKILKILSRNENLSIYSNEGNLNLK